MSGPELGSQAERRTAAAARPTLAGTLLALGAVATCLLLATWPSLTLRSSALVILVGGGLTVVAVRRPLVEESARVGVRQWLPWLLLGLSLALWELALLLLGNNDDWPPLSRLADPIDALGPGRFSLALLWIAAGAWLVRRCRR